MICKPIVQDPDSRAPIGPPPPSKTEGDEEEWRSVDESRPGSPLLEDATEQDVEDLAEDVQDVESDDKVFYLFARADK